MKYALLAASLVVILTACERPAVETPHGLPATPAAHAKNVPLRCFYPAIGCHGSDGDCMPDVVVEVPCEPVVSSVFDALDTKNNATIASAFAAGRDVLIQYVNKDYVDGVIAGTLYAQSDYGTETERMLLIRSTEKLLAVYPLLPKEK